MFKQLLHVGALLLSYGLFEGWGKLLAYAYESGIIHTLLYEQILTYVSLVLLKVRELTKTARHVVKHASKFLSRVTVSKHRWTLLGFFLFLTAFELIQDLLTEDLETIWKLTILIYLDQLDVPSQLLFVCLLLGDLWWLKILLFWLWTFLVLANIAHKTPARPPYVQPCLPVAHVFCLLVDIHDVPPP